MVGTGRAAPPPAKTSPPVATAPPSARTCGLLTGERLCIMSSRRSLFTQVLDNGYAPLGIFNYIAEKWTVPHIEPLPPLEHGLCDGSRYQHGRPSTRSPGISRLKGLGRPRQSRLTLRRLRRTCFHPALHLSGWGERLQGRARRDLCHPGGNPGRRAPCDRANRGDPFRFEFLIRGNPADGV